MYAQMEKSKETKSRAAGNSVTQKKNNVKHGFGFVDNRPESISQGILIEKIDEINKTDKVTEGYRQDTEQVGNKSNRMALHHGNTFTFSDRWGTVASGQRVESQVVQRVISEDQFIDDTTSTFFCISWRKGTQEQRTEIQGLLREFEAAEGTVERVLVLRRLTLSARLMRTDSTKFQAALDRIRDEGLELLERLEASEEWQVHEQEQQRLEEERRAEQERLELEALGELSWEDRVIAFKEKYGGAVVDTLIAGTKTLEGAAKLARLAQNYDSIGFTYTMRSVSHNAFFRGRMEGDCSTLAKSMVAIVKEIFLLDAALGSCDALVVEGTERTIDGAKAPTGDSAEYWIFDNHYWLESSNGNFDPLFARAKNEDGWHRIVGKREDAVLHLSIENYGGEFVILPLLLNAGFANIRASKVTRELWQQHCTNTSLDGVSYEQMSERLQ